MKWSEVNRSREQEDEGSAKRKESDSDETLSYSDETLGVAAIVAIMGCCYGLSFEARH